MKLPESFEARMKISLGESYDAFKSTYDEAYHVSLRVNTLKIDVKTFVEKFPYPLSPVPWTNDGFYYNPEDPVTKHPYYHAGLYYVQEPSAMSPVQALAPKRGDCCLDLCAAPGGKSMQIANAIEDHGMLVTNDIHETRVKAILRNVEKFGLRNVIVLNDSPEHIVKVMGNRFDSILIDAPCSGEGMFRKDFKAVKSWETYGPEECHVVQRDIIDTLPAFIKKESKIVYSTCTFAPIENEVQIKHLIDDYSCFKPREINLTGIDNEGDKGTHMVHIWPHLHRGEGHFIGSLLGSGAIECENIRYEENQPPEVFKDFMEKHLKTPIVGHFKMIQERLYLMPELHFPTKGLRVVREGLLLGEIKKDRFTPSQALAIHLSAHNFKPMINFSSESIEAIKYLKCETLHVDTDTEGLHLVCTDGFPLGFAKITGGVLKNQYPVSWRMM